MIASNRLFSRLPVAAGVLLFGSVLFGEQTDRKVTINGVALDGARRAILEQVERAYGFRLPDAPFWYDKRSGAIGLWNGPGLGQIPAGLDVGGPMPANCSGGGTRVFVNGRELHPYDVAVLSQLGQVLPGRYFVEANGNFGFERGPAMGNLFLLAQRAGRQQPRKSILSGMYSHGDMIVNSAGAVDSKTGASFYPGK